MIRIRTITTLLLATLPLAGFAAPIAFTDPAAFQAAVAGLNNPTSSTLTFEGQSDGDLIASGDTVEGITFTYDFGGVSLEIRNEFDTTSPPNHRSWNHHQ